MVHFWSEMQHGELEELMMSTYVNSILGQCVFGGQCGHNEATPMGNLTADTHHVFATNVTVMCSVVEIQHPDMVVHSNATFVD